MLKIMVENLYLIHLELKKEDILKITSIIKDISAEKFVDPYLQTK